MNRNIKNKIYTTINQLHEELDKSYELKNQLSFDNEFPELITNETRIKVLKEYIEIYKLAKKNVNDETILDRTKNINKKLNLHLHQLKKLQTKNYQDNVKYFTVLTQVLCFLSTLN